jgi:hypothetical protein
MEFNYLSEHGAINLVASSAARDASANAPTARYGIVMERMPAAIASLARELLQMEATGDRPRVEAWFAKYDRMPPDLAKDLAADSDVPVDIDPVFSFPEPIR